MGPEHPETATGFALCLVVESLRKQKTIKESSLFECLSVIERGRWWVDAELLLRTTLCNVGVYLQKLRKHKEATRLLLKSKEMFEKGRATEKTEFAAVLNNVAFSLQAAGKRSEAMDHYRRALALLEASNLITRDHPFRIAVLEHIAALYRELGREERAEETRRMIDETVQDGEYARSFRFQQPLLHHCLMSVMREPGVL